MIRFNSFALWLAVAASLGFLNAARAQTYLKNVVVVSGGVFSDPNNYVKVGVYNPATKSFKEVDSVRSESTYSAIADSGIAYIAADSVLLAYDLDNNRRVGKAVSTGYTNMAVYGKYLLVTRSYAATSDFVEVYNKKTLAKVGAISGLTQASYGIAIAGDSAYVGEPGDFNGTKGYIGIVDLKTMMLKREIDLDSLGAGSMGKLVSNGKTIYTTNSKYNAVISIEITTGKARTHIVPQSQGAVADIITALHDTLLMPVNYSYIGAYDAAHDSMLSFNYFDFGKFPTIGTAFPIEAAAAYDYLSKDLYLSTTDYVSFGRAYVVNSLGNIIDSMTTGVSPQAIALDYRTHSAGIEEAKYSLSAISLYPNPASTVLYIQMPDAQEGILDITDMSGRSIAHSSLLQGHNTTLSLPLTNVEEGVYMLSYRTAAGICTQKFIKQ